MTETKIKELEKRIGYEFHDMKTADDRRCATALMRMSTVRDRSHDNERLEFLGDAVLEVYRAVIFSFTSIRICRRES